MIVTVYGRPDCHLCDEAMAGLTELRREFPGLELVEVDIDEDERLLRRYLERIPVIEAGGGIIGELVFEPDPIRAALTELESASPGDRGQVR
ncbi:MAG: glutaredoxin family protein [Solirubrobacterales bacterium]|nr:glutaredoxin family protein [Solirubrobacterales bacterium]